MTGFITARCAAVAAGSARIAIDPLLLREPVVPSRAPLGPQDAPTEPSPGCPLDVYELPTKTT
jgi:hypothetical protein